MRSDLLVLLLLVLVVLLGSALCSGVEAALLTVNPIRVQICISLHNWICRWRDYWLASWFFDRPIN